METAYAISRGHAHNKGFTLVEIIVVLVILAILAAIIIPSMTGWIDEAANKSVIIECRQCVLAAQTIASEKYGEGINSIDLTTYGAAILKLAGTPDGSAITKLTAENGTVSLLVYSSAKKVVVTYENGTYTIGGQAASPVIQNAQTFLEHAIQIEATLKKYYSGTDFISAVGTLPSVSTSDIFGNKTLQSGAKTLYWRPKVITIDGKKTVVLYANSGSTGHANWQAYAFYYNGKIYRSTSLFMNTNRINPNQLNGITDFDSFISDPNNHWELAS